MEKTDVKSGHGDEVLEVQGSELSEADREEVGAFLASQPSWFRNDNEKANFFRRIHEFGPKAVSFILEKVRATKDGGEIFNLLRNLDYAATEGDAKRIGELLENEDIVHDSDRSNKHSVLEVLNRIGVLENVPQLKKYAESSFETKYGSRSFSGQDSFNRGDAIDAITALLYIKNGVETLSDDDRAFIDEAVEYIRNLIGEKGFLPLSHEALFSISSQANRSELIESYKRQFDSVTPSPRDRFLKDRFDDIEGVDEFDNPFGRRYGDDSSGDGFNEDEFMQTLNSLIRSLDRTRRSIEKDGDYEFFGRKIERDELFEYCKKIAEYLHDEGIQNFVVIDRSSRPVYIGVKEYWKHQYPDEKSPNVYFMNPSGFKSKEEVGKDSKVDAPTNLLKTREQIVEEFERVYTELSKAKDEPVLVFDSCIHSGDTLLPITKVMKNSGFKDIRVGSINPSDRGASVETDFYVTTERPEMGCYPFDRDRMIEKVFYSLYSQRTSDEDEMARSVRLRKEIKKIMEEKIKENEGK